MHVCSAKVRDETALIANGLYWAAMASEEEADYLCALLNAPVTTELTRPFMSYGKDERHIHKHVWELPIPTFEPTNLVHRRLGELGRQLEQTVQTFPINSELQLCPLLVDTYETSSWPRQRALS